jgi:hypothetical protein
MYRKIPQCRICRSPYGDKIDLDLLQRMTYGRLLEKYAPLFPEDRPLTRASLKGHWKHLKAAVAVEAVARVAASQNHQAHSSERQEIFEVAVQQRINEIEVLEQLVVSGLTDLKQIGPKEGENDFAVLNRDRVRRNTASIVMDSAKVKQMALQAEEDRHRLEKGRVVFRMFQLFARALETAPIEYRAHVAAQLKVVIRDDDEINALIREQSKPAIAVASVIDD